MIQQQFVESEFSIRDHELVLAVPPNKVAAAVFDPPVVPLLPCWTRPELAVFA